MSRARVAGWRALKLADNSTKMVSMTASDTLKDAKRARVAMLSDVRKPKWVNIDVKCYPCCLEFVSHHTTKKPLISSGLFVKTDPAGWQRKVTGPAKDV